jgi:predicted transcriptional regulator
MPKKYRTKTEIIAQILKAAASGRTDDGITKTRIMYSLFLSHDSLQEYLSILVQNRLLEYLPLPQTYKTTEKGLRLLKLLEQLQQELAATTNNNNNNSTSHRSINKDSGCR